MLRIKCAGCNKIHTICAEENIIEDNGEYIISHLPCPNCLSEINRIEEWQYELQLIAKKILEYLG